MLIEVAAVIAQLPKMLFSSSTGPQAASGYRSSCYDAQRRRLFFLFCSVLFYSALSFSFQHEANSVAQHRVVIADSEADPHSGEPTGEDVPQVQRVQVTQSGRRLTAFAQHYIYMQHIHSKV